MVRCPDGHESASDDYCDVCGMRIGAAPAAAAPAGAASSPDASAGGPAATTASGEVCPACGTARSGMFCESCGYNFATATPAVPTLAMETSPDIQITPAPPITVAPDPGPSAVAGWTAVVAADRAYYDKVEADAGPDGSGIDFPSYCPERRFALTGPQMQIGRRSPSRGLNPEIDLTGPPADPGISRLHAVLLATSDGWAVLDPGSANGTQLNGTDVVSGEQVPLHPGDQITLGAWTKITILAP